MDKIKAIFKHINDYCKEEGYRQCLVQWKQIQPFISKEETPYQCGNCNTYWSSGKFIDDHDNICPKCDTHCQPMLCNPINWISVLEYINPKYHHYLIPKHHIIDTAHFLDYIKDKLTDNNIILIDDNFTNFLNGLTLKTLNIEYIGFYEQKTNNVYFCVNNPDKYKCNILYNSWLMFMDIYDDNKININIYAVCHGLFYKEDEYELDRKYLYKYLMNKIVDKWINDDE
jgi:hypothetical protein